MQLRVISYRLHDGHLLCELLNTVHEGAISEKVLGWCDKLTVLSPNKSPGIIAVQRFRVQVEAS